MNAAAGTAGGQDDEHQRDGREAACRASFKYSLSHKTSRKSPNILTHLLFIKFLAFFFEVYQIFHISFCFKRKGLKFMKEKFKIKKASHTAVPLRRERKPSKEPNQYNAKAVLILLLRNDELQTDGKWRQILWVHYWVRWKNIKKQLQFCHTKIDSVSTSLRKKKQFCPAERRVAEVGEERKTK